MKNRKRKPGTTFYCHNEGYVYLSLLFNKHKLKH